MWLEAAGAALNVTAVASGPSYDATVTLPPLGNTCKRGETDSSLIVQVPKVTVGKDTQDKHDMRLSNWKL